MSSADNAGSELRVRVRLYNIVADQVGKQVDEWWLPEGSVIADLLRVLVVQHPALSRYVSANDASAPSPLRLFHNGRIVLNASDTLHDGDEIRVFPIICGG